MCKEGEVEEEKEVIGSTRPGGEGTSASLGEASPSLFNGREGETACGRGMLAL